MRASVWVCEKVEGRKKMSDSRQAATTGAGNWAPWAPVGVMTTIVGTAPTAWAAAARASAIRILLVSVEITTFSPGLAPAQSIARMAPRIISIKLDGPGT